MVRKSGVALLVGLTLVACSWASPAPGKPDATSGQSSTSVFATLSGVPPKVPRLVSGQPCPLSKPTQLGPHLGMGLGSGPVYVFSGQIVQSDTAHPNKVAWAADPSYSGPIRIRGGRVDGTGQLLLDSFDNRWPGAAVKTIDGSKLMPELDLLESHSTFPNVPVGWRMWPSGTYIATPGCYAWQVDGIGFTELITFHSLDLVTLPAGAPCPATRQQVAHTLSAEFGSGPAVGNGPVYALMGEMQAGVLKYRQSEFNGWALHSKVLWMATPEVRGMVQIRGRQIDGQVVGPNWIGFGAGAVPEFVLQWEIASQSGWASLPSEIRIPAPGCYAFQVDSPKGSDVVVFQVVGIQ